MAERGAREYDNMWEEGEEGPSRAVARPLARKADLHGALFNELMQEVKHSAPGARLSARLRTAIERLAPGERRALCSRTRDGCAPLFVACRRGNLEAVEYLVHVCNAELEQRGLYEVPDERCVHCVTPLWCAAVAGRLSVLRALADAGAALDAGSDSGSTPVRSACFMTHFDVVRFLVSRGADIRKPNHNGGTCLINSVQSVRLCGFLLDNGAEVDARDMQHKTALHYAIQEHRPETAKLLLARGADPRLRSRAGDDALRTAALKGASQIVGMLAARVRYGAARLADAHELLGATKLDEFNDVAACLAAWRRATALRHAESEYVEKTPALEPHPALGLAREWRSLEELEAAAGDADSLRSQALLVAGRVLGPRHKEHVFRLMYRGASYADSFRYQRCIDLWMWAFEIRLEKDTILYADTCHTACALTRLLMDARGVLAAGPYAAALRLATLMLDHLPEARERLAVRPVFKKQADTFDRALRCLAHLLHLLHAAPATPHEKQQVLQTARRAVRLGLCSAQTGDSLLHLACSRLTVVRSPFAAEAAPGPGPGPGQEPGQGPGLARAALVSLLLAAGADATRRNHARATPLHVAAVPYNYCPELVEVLLAGGAHLDQPNKLGETARELLAPALGAAAAGPALGAAAAGPARALRPLRHLTLACLAARALLAHDPAAQVPRHLEDFIELHRS